MPHFISVVIPTRNRINYLPRLFNSILEQTFTDFNIIVSDNSDDNSVESFIQQYSDRLSIIYRRNDPPTGMAENWNRCMDMATGTWVKMIHDDDWFADKTTLQKFADATTGENTGMVFSSHNLYSEHTGEQKIVSTTQAEVQKIQADPFVMFYNNVVGPPSTMMVRRDVNEPYDTRMTWFTDLDQYMRVIKRFRVNYIDEPLITICHNESQLTNSCFRKRGVEIPEALMCYEKYGMQMMKNITDQDHWWRFVRNLDIRSREEFTEHSHGYPVPKFLFSIIDMQCRIPAQMLKNGFVSKAAMALHYFISFKPSS